MRVPSFPVLALLAALAVPARAEPSPTAEKAAEVTEPRVALSANSPLSWLRRSFGASLSVGIDRHHAIRANLAHYNADDMLLLIAARGERFPRHGGIFDLGIGWTYYPGRLWDGFMLEVGAIRRERDVEVSEDLDSETTRSVAHGGRATIGWSWRLGGAGFVALAAGLSVSREVGTVTERREPGMDTATPIDRRQVDPEVYLRIGLALGGRAPGR